MNIYGIRCQPLITDFKNLFYYPHPEAKYTIVHPKGIGEVVAES